MIAVFLCAGFATRMYPITRDFPKPLLTVADRPVLDYLMDQVSQLTDIESIHVVTNARFIEHFERWQYDWQSICRSKNIRIELYNDGAAENENRLGAIRDLQFVLRRLPEPSRALVSAGDNIYRFALQPLWQHFLTGNEHFVIALPETDDAKLKKTGVLSLGENDRVLRLHEKPRRPASTWSSPPLYFLQGSAWRRLDEYVQASDRCDAPGSFIDFLSRKETVYALKPNASRLDIGSINAYHDADRHLRNEPVIQ